LHEQGDLHWHWQLQHLQPVINAAKLDQVSH